MSTQYKCLSTYLTIFLEATYSLQTFSYECEKEIVNRKCVVGNQRNRLKGTVPMSTQYKCLSTYLTIFLEATYSLQTFSYECEKEIVNRKCVVGNQKNRLKGTVPMSTQYKCLSTYLTIFWKRHI